MDNGPTYTCLYPKKVKCAKLKLILNYLKTQFS